MDQPTAHDALRRLEPLVGEWTLEATPPGADPWPGGGRASFEWHDSGAHLVERVTMGLPEAPDNVSIIGCDGANATFWQLVGRLEDGGRTIAGRWDRTENGEWIVDFELVFTRVA
jgi:hypothetical protein